MMNNETKVMNAIMYKKYGGTDVLSLEETSVPEPKSDEVLVRVKAASLNAADWRLMSANPFMVRLAMGLFAPKNKILGRDFAGEVHAVGDQVRGIKVGDKVFGEVPFNTNGSFAEYTCVREEYVAHMPKNLDYTTNATLPLAGMTVITAIMNIAKIKSGEKVLILGASGGVGYLAVQLAHYLGAEITGFCSSRNIELIQSMGCVAVDYTQNSIDTLSAQYDVILAINGNYSFSQLSRRLSPSGSCVLIGGTGKMFMSWMCFSRLQSRLRKKSFLICNSNAGKEMLEKLAHLTEEGAFTPLIDKVFSFHEVPKAIDYLLTKHAQGKIAIDTNSTIQDK